MQKLIDDDGLNGLTSNFTIFEKAIVESDDYSELIEELCSEADLDSAQPYDRLAIAEVLRPIDADTKSQHGYVSVRGLPLSRG